MLKLTYASFYRSTSISGLSTKIEVSILSKDNLKPKMKIQKYHSSLIH